MLAETTNNITGWPIELWVGLISGGSALLGGAVSGFFALMGTRMSNKANYKSRYDEWSWGNAYALLGEIDYLHRQFTHYQTRLNDESTDWQPVTADEYTEYKEFIDRFYNALSRLTILTSNQDVLHLIAQLREAARKLAGLPIRTSGDRVSPIEFKEHFSEINKSIQARERLIELVQGNILDVMMPTSTKGAVSAKLS